jgi:hypothetical protein
VLAGVLIGDPKQFAATLARRFNGHGGEPARQAKNTAICGPIFYAAGLFVATPAGALGNCARLAVKTLASGCAKAIECQEQARPKSSAGATERIFGRGEKLCHRSGRSLAFWCCCR